MPIEEHELEKVVESLVDAAINSGRKFSSGEELLIFLNEKAIELVNGIEVSTELLLEAAAEYFHRSAQSTSKSPVIPL